MQRLGLTNTGCVEIKDLFQEPLDLQQRPPDPMAEDHWGRGGHAPQFLIFYIIYIYIYINYFQFFKFFYQM